jgi:phosphoenolpyruvate phosphomutase
MKEIGTTPDLKRASLWRMLNAKPLVRLLDLHNGLSGLIIEKIGIETPRGRKELAEITLTESLLNPGRFNLSPNQK